MKKIQIINGPNLNLLGKREPTVYGNASFEDYLSELRARFPQCEISYYQSNVEGEIINKIHEVGFEYDGIVLNAGAYTHTSIALHDAIKAVTTPVDDIGGMQGSDSWVWAGFVSVGDRIVYVIKGLEGYQIELIIRL